MDLALKAQSIWLIVLILLIGILGVLVLAGLAVARARFHARLDAQRKAAAAPEDLWKISGERLSTAPGNDPTSDDEESPQDEEDHDEHPRRR